MLTKPDLCRGCPFYHCSGGFVPDTIVPESKVMFIAQNPGAEEEEGHKLLKRHWAYGQSYDEFETVTPAPLIGATGLMFNTKFLPLAGLKRADISLGNAIRCRPGVSLGMAPNDLPVLTNAMHLETSKADIVKALRHCRDMHLHVPESVDTVVTMGRYALFSLTGIKHEEGKETRQGVMEAWRGYGVGVRSWHDWNVVDTTVYHPLQSGKVVFFTTHIASLYGGRDKRYLHATLHDFQKLAQLRSGKWPQVVPQWSTAPPALWPGYAAFDTEYTVPENTLIRWSLCDTDWNLYCIEAQSTPHNRVPITQGATVILQNAQADLPHLHHLVDLQSVKIEDMMLAHSVLWTGEPHSLNYIASMYGALNRYKHLSKDSPQMYSAMDAFEPMHIWRSHFIPEFTNDQLSWKVYQSLRLPLIPIIAKAEETGVAVDSARLRLVQQITQDRLAQYQAEAKGITGDITFHLGGTKQLRGRIYG